MPTNPPGYMNLYYKANKDKFNNPKEKKKRAARNRARRLMEKKVGKAALKGKDVDHKKPLRNGGGNGVKNLRVLSIKKNRAGNGKQKKK